jgi:hypothetical protein
MIRFDSLSDLLKSHKAIYPGLSVGIITDDGAIISVSNKGSETVFTAVATLFVEYKEADPSIDTLIYKTSLHHICCRPFCTLADGCKIFLVIACDLSVESLSKVFDQVFEDLSFLKSTFATMTKKFID